MGKSNCLSAVLESGPDQHLGEQLLEEFEPELEPEVGMPTERTALER
jgi:hypothetical protein